MNDTNSMTKETQGAWIVHHGKKIRLDTSGSSEFPALDLAAKSADLLTRLSSDDTIRLTDEKVKAYAKAAGLNPLYELNGILDILEERRLIDRAAGEVEVIGVTSKGTLIHATDIFFNSNPTQEENASLILSEKASVQPVLQNQAVEYIGDLFQMTKNNTNDFIIRSQDIGFVDSEGIDNDRLLFNGNLFRRDKINKTAKVLSSLSSMEQVKVVEFEDLFKQVGCIKVAKAEQILGISLFEKLKAAGLYDINVVSNDSGENVYITDPGAFHKFTDPLVDDCFDMAKALVAALTFGIQERSSSSGRIQDISVLLGKLVNGYTIGPATAIGQDYRILENNGVVQIVPDSRYPDRFSMKLLKKDVGAIALKVLTTGNASESALTTLPSAPLSRYSGPEQNRQLTRKKQGIASKKETQDILSAIRGGSSL